MQADWVYSPHWNQHIYELYIYMDAGRVADQPHGCATARMDPIMSCLIKLSSDNFHTAHVAGQFRGHVCPCVEPASAGWVEWDVAAAGLHVPCPLCALPSVVCSVSSRSCGTPSL